MLFRFVGRVLLLLLSSSISFPCLGFLRLGPRSRNPGAALLPGAAFHRLGPTKGNQPQQSDGEAVLTKKEERERERERITTLPNPKYMFARGVGFSFLAPDLKNTVFCLCLGGPPRKRPGEGGRHPDRIGRGGGWLGGRAAGWVSGWALPRCALDLKKTCILPVFTSS